MKFKIKNIFLFNFLVEISFIYAISQLKYEIPISYSSSQNFPIINILFNEENNASPLLLDIGQEKSWIYEPDNIIKDDKNLLNLKYDTFSISGESEKEQCYLSDKENNKIFKIENFVYIKVNQIKGNKPSFNAFSLNNLMNNFLEKNYLFNIDFVSKKLCIDDKLLSDNEKQNLKKFELINIKGNNKWNLNLTAIFFDDDNTHLKNKKENLYKISNETFGIFINKNLILETIYSSFYVPKEFFDILGDCDYFLDDNNEKICEKKIENGMILYYCNKSKMDKIKNINLVIDNKYVLSLKKENLIKCPSDDSSLCQFIIKYNPQITNFVLGFDILKNMSIFFMGENNSIYFENNKNLEINECNLNEAKFMILGIKDIKKALLQLLKTFSVVICMFIFLFIFFFIHSKFRGHLYTDEEKDNKEKDEELVEIQEENSDKNNDK